MITGIGVDVVQVNRMNKWLEKKGLLEKHFHNDELSKILNGQKNAARSLAAKFAAKEAFGKALGTGMRGISLKDILVLNNENGKPRLVLLDTARKKFEESGAQKIHVSLSHEREYAAAVIILESSP